MFLDEYQICMEDLEQIGEDEAEHHTLASRLYREVRSVFCPPSFYPTSAHDIDCRNWPMRKIGNNLRSRPCRSRNSRIAAVKGRIAASD